MKYAAAFLLVFMLLAPPPARASGQPLPVQFEKITATRQEMNDAIKKVAKIVNQPVVHLPFDPTKNPAIFSPGWFHEGALTPDFNAVDIRKYQEFPYAGKPYVSSNLNPTEMFLGDELEFNSMTKYFYTARNLPKKKLTEQEMVEINRLYRIIGRDQKELIALENPSAGRDLSLHGLLHSGFSILIPIAFFVGGIVWVFFFRKRV